MNRALASRHDTPLEEIDAFHDTMRTQARALCVLADAGEAPGFPESEDRAAAAAIVRCFDHAAFQHHRDEEEDLFPALVNVVPSNELNALRALTFRLVRDHRRLEALWAPIARMVAGIACGQRAALLPAHAAEFAVTLERHLAYEDLHLLPLARRLVSRRVEQRIGERMAMRREPPAH